MAGLAATLAFVYIFSTVLIVGSLIGLFLYLCLWLVNLWEHR